MIPKWKPRETNSVKTLKIILNNFQNHPSVICIMEL